jgi:hypothetical protein
VRAGFAGHGLGQQGLAVARRAVEQAAPAAPGADMPEETPSGPNFPGLPGLGMSRCRTG